MRLFKSLTISKALSTDQATLRALKAHAVNLLKAEQTCTYKNLHKHVNCRLNPNPRTYRKGGKALDSSNRAYCKRIGANYAYKAMIPPHPTLFSLSSVFHIPERSANLHCLEQPSEPRSGVTMGALSVCVGSRLRSAKVKRSNHSNGRLIHPPRERIKSTASCQPFRSPSCRGMIRSSYSLANRRESFRMVAM